MLVWLLALSCCGEGCTGDQYIPWDAVSHLPCCHVHDQFNILAVLLLLAWGLSLEAVAVGDMGWWWAPVFGSHALVGCPTLFFSSCRRAMSAESYSALSCLPQFFFSKNHSFLVAFTSFSAAPAEQKAGALQRPFIFRCEILCAFNYFYK